MSVELKRGYYILNTDGGMASNGRPRRAGDPLGIAAIGALLRTRHLVALDEISEVIGPATHNEAEYRSLIGGLKLARDHGIERIRVYMDSELVVDQMNGLAAVKQAHLTLLHEDAKAVVAEFRSFRISWVPREMNVEADRLVRKAFSREAAVGTAASSELGRLAYQVKPTVAELAGTEGSKTVQNTQEMMRVGAPRTNADPAELVRKQQLLSSPHMAPLTRYVERLRIERGPNTWVPYFDSTDAGVSARLLILLESPGPRGSRFVSTDNNDQTAENMWNLLHEAGVQRDRDMIAWNVVPWYVGREPSSNEVKAGRPWVVELISLLSELRVVVLLGKTAAKSWDGLEVDLPVIRAPHPSPQNLNTRPGARAELREALIEARQLSTSF